MKSPPIKGRLRRQRREAVRLAAKRPTARLLSPGSLPKPAPAFRDERGLLLWPDRHGDPIPLKEHSVTTLIEACRALDRLRETALAACLHLQSKDAEASYAEAKRAARIVRWRRALTLHLHQRAPKRGVLPEIVATGFEFYADPHVMTGDVNAPL